MAEAFFSMKNIVKEYDMAGEKLRILKGIHLEVQRGEFLSILGPSGSGKSTLMNVIGCLDTMTTGGLDEVIADHRNLLNAIERCDLAAFEPLVERHLYGGIRRLGSKLTKEYADFFEPENVK